MGFFESEFFSNPLKTVTPISFLFFFLGGHVIALLTYPKNCTVSRNVWRSYSTACTHAAMSGVLSLMVCLTEVKWMQGSPQAFAVHCFSVGYFVHDSLHLMTSKEKISSWDIYFHHGMIITFTTYTFFVCPCSGYGVWDYLSEISNVFLHSRKLIVMAGYQKTSLHYTILQYLYYATFLIFRFIPQLLVLVKLFLDVPEEHSWFCCLLCLPSQLFLIWIGIDIAYKIVQGERKRKQKV